MVMGAVYLTYSAYFLSSDFSGISLFMRVNIHFITLFLGTYDNIVFEYDLHQPEKP